MNASFFVTATGTDVGKTYVLCDILRQLRVHGHVVHALKPVLSGFSENDVSSSDSGRLLQALGLDVSAQALNSITPWRFRAPLSPDMAAQRERRTVRLDSVTSYCRSFAEQHQGLLFIEGAGGVMSPLGTDFTNLDLACVVGARVLLVAGGYLGTISHTLTAVEALRRRGLTPLATILSGRHDDPVSLGETRDTLLRFQSPPVFCVEEGGFVPSNLIELVLDQSQRA